MGSRGVRASAPAPGESPDRSLRKPKVYHVIERTALRDSTTLTVNDLPPHIGASPARIVRSPFKWATRWMMWWARRVWRTVKSVKDKTRAARVLRIGRSTVYKCLQHRDGRPRRNDR